MVFSISDRVTAIMSRWHTHSYILKLQHDHTEAVNVKVMIEWMHAYDEAVVSGEPFEIYCPAFAMTTATGDENIDPEASERIVKIRAKLAY